MIITINLDQNILDYLDSVCGGMPGRSHYISNLLVADAQNHLEYPVQTSPEENYAEQVTRLHRRQRGFAAPQAPVKQRDRSGSVRRPRQTGSIRRGSS